MAAIPSNLANHSTHFVLDLDCTWEQQPEDSRNMRCNVVLRQSFTLATSPCVFANSEMETYWESCIIHFPTKPPCSTRVDWLETSDVLILFSLPQMTNLGITIELHPKGDKITCRAFGLHSSPAEYSTI